MFPLAPATELFALDPRQRAQALDAQRKRATEFLLSSGRRFPNERLPELSERIFWLTYVRIKPIHLRRILSAFPYVERMLAKYGYIESAMEAMCNAVSALLVGTEFSDTHEFKDILERQAYNFFNELDRHDERIGNPAAKSLNALPLLREDQMEPFPARSASPGQLFRQARASFKQKSMGDGTLSDDDEGEDH